MSLQNIIDRISAAQAAEADSPLLDILLTAKLSSLHPSIHLPSDQPLASLRRLVEAYVARVPEFIEAATEISKASDVWQYTGPFIESAAECFLKPPEEPQLEGFSGLIDGAYVAHRLLEEINDRFIARASMPLLPLDMTRSNLLMHHLIGEAYANELDSQVFVAVEVLMQKEKAFEKKAFRNYVNKRLARGWEDEIRRYPCLAQDLDVDIRFGGL